MLIEKVFAIEAAPAAIWEALWADLGSGEDGSFEVEESNWPRRLRLRLKLSGMPCLLTYRIEPQDEGAEVSAALEPLSPFFGLYQVLTFGHLKRNYEIMLVVALANLKKAVEPPAVSLEADPPSPDGAGGP